jgi:hypothetical protein
LREKKHYGAFASKQIELRQYKLEPRLPREPIRGQWRNIEEGLRLIVEYSNASTKPIRNEAPGSDFFVLKPGVALLVWAHRAAAFIAAEPQRHADATTQER